jgi:hypothetical protein
MEMRFLAKYSVIPPFGGCCRICGIHHLRLTQTNGTGKSAPAIQATEIRNAESHSLRLRESHEGRLEIFILKIRDGASCIRSSSSLSLVKDVTTETNALLARDESLSQGEADGQKSGLREVRDDFQTCCLFKFDPDFPQTRGNPGADLSHSDWPSTNSGKSPSFN